MTGNRRFTLLFTVLFTMLLALASTGCPPGQPRTPPATVGERLAPIGEPYLTGIGPRSIEEAKGMVVVVEFWATYCDPCLRSFPAYQKLHEKGGVAIISVALDEPSDVAEADIKEFVDKAGAKFVVLWDQDQSTIDTYGLRKMPSALIVDKKGVLRHIHGGYEAKTAEQIEADVAALIAE